MRVVYVTMKRLESKRKKKSIQKGELYSKSVGQVRRAYKEKGEKGEKMKRIDKAID